MTHSRPLLQAISEIILHNHLAYCVAPVLLITSVNFRTNYSQPFLQGKLLKYFTKIQPLVVFYMDIVSSAVVVQFVVSLMTVVAQVTAVG